MNIKVSFEKKAINIRIDFDTEIKKIAPIKSLTSEIPMPCPSCGSSHTIKCGLSGSGVPRRRCKECRKIYSISGVKRGRPRKQI